MTDSERLKKVINSEGLSTNAFGKHIGLKSSQVLYDVLKGRNGISKELAEQITASCVNINAGWLLTGEGVMSKDSIEKYDPSPPAENMAQTNINALVNIIDKLSDSDKRNSQSIEVMSKSIQELIAQGRDQVDNITKLVNLLCQNGVDVTSPVLDREKGGLKSTGGSRRDSVTDVDPANVG